MKPMLSSTFRKRVHMIGRGDLHMFLQDNFEHYLPDDMPGGTVPTEELVRDYIAYHLALEKSTISLSSYQPNNRRSKSKC